MDTGKRGSPNKVRDASASDTAENEALDESGERLSRILGEVNVSCLSFLFFD
jgi:hypothetical protein